MSSSTILQVSTRNAPGEIQSRILARSLRAAKLLCMAISVFCLQACDRMETVRYRVTLEVEADGRVHKGSSVWEFKLGPGGIVYPHSADFRGEAIVVDLAQRGLLIGVLAGRASKGEIADSYAGMLPENSFRRSGRIPEDVWSKDRVAALRLINKDYGLTAELNCKPDPDWIECPYLIRFRNIADPKTVEAVDPANLSASYGPGVKLRRATIEITDDPVTTGIKDRLPWLAKFDHGGMLSGSFDKDHQRPEINLNGTYFSQGDAS